MNFIVEKSQQQNDSSVISMKTINNMSSHVSWLGIIIPNCIVMARHGSRMIVEEKDHKIFL